MALNSTFEAPVHRRMIFKIDLPPRSIISTALPQRVKQFWMALAMMTSPMLSFGQVPGICTQPDGATWPMNYVANAGVPTSSQTAPGMPPASPLPLAPSRLLPANLANLNSQSDTAQLKAFLNGSVPPSPKAGAINRYAPHSVPSLHGVPAPNRPSPFNLASNRNRAQSGDDDLLTTPAVSNPQGDDLLTPQPNAPSSDPLSGMGPDAAKESERTQQKAQTPANNQAAIDPHQEVFANEKYPSAITCAKCHQKIYDEWRVSGHAYAAVSPMFQRFEQAVADLTRGTSGTFCVRCHAPVATQMDYPREANIFAGPAVFREGITCIACHRVVERYGRVNGERRMETGSAYDPVVGNIGGDGIAGVIRDAENFKVKTDPNDKRPLQGIHQGAIKFEQLSDSSFCAGCHQVMVQPGIALEVVYQQYRSGPACKKGISCQDCHMGAVPGKPHGYTYGAAAEVNGKTIHTNRKHSNHIFHGPSYPLAHPGIFPHNEKSLRWTAEQWLQFEHRDGWGTESFESALSRGEFQCRFPAAWSSAQERRDARKVLDENQKLLDVKRDSAQQTLENGSRIDGPFFVSDPRVGRDIKLNYIISNTSEGHNMPSGSLGAQPQLWLNTVLIGPDGSHLWESGHLDTNGDICDWHSLDVRAGRFQRDSQLMNLQTKFLITNVKGTEREMYLPVPVDIDPLPFFRPGTVPYTVLNHPPLIRMEAHSVPPLDSRTAHYSIPGKLISTPGVYRLSVRLRSRVEPAYFMIFCQGTPDMLRSLNESIFDVHPYSTEFVVR
jgi:nitrate/TMAO reductase-like tetraheme cytochrome c subunit